MESHYPAELNEHRGPIRLRIRGVILNVVDVANAVHCSKRIEGEVVAFVEIAHFYYVLIE